MHIPLCDIKANYLKYKIAIDSSISRVIDDSSYILGKEVSEFENEWSKYCGSKYCIGVSNATNGLFLALKTMEIKEYDEVIIPTFTVTADIEAVLMAGAMPVLVDCNSRGNISVDSIVKSISKNTKAIIVVHMFGNAASIEEICNIAKRYNLLIIEDCSHAHGAEINGKKLGTFGNIGVFSFFPSKILGSFGDAGAVITDSKYYADKIAAYRDHGRIRGDKYTHAYAGYNMRLAGLQAAILRAKIPYLDECVKYRQMVAINYNDGISGKVRPVITDTSKCVYYVYPVECEDRNHMIELLKKNEIGTGIHYPVPIHKQPFYMEEYCDLQLPNSEKLSDKIFSLPMYPELNESDQNKIIKIINE